MSNFEALLRTSVASAYYEKGIPFCFLRLMMVYSLIFFHSVSRFVLRALYLICVTLQACFVVVPSVSSSLELKSGN